MRKRAISIGLGFMLAACSDPSMGPDTNESQQLSGRDSPASSAKQLSGQEAADQDHAGYGIFVDNCASCHMGGVERAPHRAALNMMPYDSVLLSLQTGLMRTQAEALSDQEKMLVAEYLSGGRPAGESVVLPPKCQGPAADFDYGHPPLAQGWGIDRENTHFIDADTAGLSAADVPRLSLKWAFAYPNATRARSQPSFAGGALVVGSQDGTVYALDEKTGCVRWTFKASAEVRTGITFSEWTTGKVPEDPPLAFFADLMSWVYAVNAVTGELVWSKKVGLHPSATTTAQPAFFEGVLFQPVSALEVVPAIDPEYPCCSFRGSVVALDGRTGAQKWRSYTITEPLEQTRLNDAGTPNFGPSGAPIWNSPTIDERRRRLYAGTGENYSSPAQGSSDAIIAFDIDTGEIIWIRQTVAGDAWNVACMPNTPTPENCPEEIGPDVDFASPPILIRDGEREILVAGQKNGQAHGIDPETGEQIWRTQVGRGGNQGGTHFGIAAEGTTVFVPMSDYDDRMLPVSEAKPGIFGLDAFTGAIKWSAIAENLCGEREYCDPGVSAAVTSIPGIVFAGHMDGWLRAYDTATGEVVWETDTDRAFETITGAEGHGGSFGGGSAPIVKDGHLYVNSGYGIYFHMPGNVLMVFSVDGAEPADTVEPNTD